MTTPQSNIRYFSCILAVIWSVLIFSSFFWFYYQQHSNQIEIAKAEARVAIEKDILYRKWATGHGGVYVPSTSETPPNPYLSQVPERDVTTPLNKQLTLVNPAYMTRQVYELANRENRLIRGHITSLKPIRPENAPDPWERKALESFETGNRELSELLSFNGRDYIRLMRPFVTEKGCLKCHASQGYRIGDIRGGISVSVPLATYAGYSNRLIAGTAMGHGIIWLIGLGMIGLGSKKLSVSSLKLQEKNYLLEEEIAERQITQDALQEQAVLLEEEICERLKTHSQLQLIMDSTFDAIYGIDTSGACIFVNKACLQLTGYDSVSDLIGRNMHEMIHHTLPNGQPAPQSQCRIFHAYREGKGVTVDDEYFWKKDGSSFPVEYSSYPIINNGVIEGAVISFIDISRRKESEEALKESSAFNEQIINSAQEGIIVYDRELRYRVWNPYMEGLTGYRADEVIGKHPLELFPFLKDAGVIDRLTWVLAGNEVEPSDFAFDIPQKGKRGLASDLSAPLRNKNGDVIGIIGTVRNITEHRKLEEQLRHSQKLEAVGQLAGGVAHDFNNILTVISGYGSLMQMQLEEDNPTREMVDQIVSATERAANLTKSLLTFSRKTEMIVKPVNLNDVVAGVGKFLKRIIGEDIALSTNLKNDPLRVMIDTGQIEQVLMNFATNARDAMTNGGILSIETEFQEINADYIDTHGYGVPGRYAVIVVSDNGCGMDEETRQNIFDPFFTTKGMGKGTGLGMSIVHGIISQHNGFINVQSQVGVGTSFRIYIPILNMNGHNLSDSKLPEAPKRGTETILLVEDDESVRNLVEKLLSSFGYSVIVSINGADGVDKFREYADSIQLVIMDVIMPEKSGKQAFDEIRKLKSDTKVLFMSGYAAKLFNEHEEFKGNFEYMVKPIKPLEMLDKIRRILDS